MLFSVFKTNKWRGIRDYLNTFKHNDYLTRRQALKDLRLIYDDKVVDNYFCYCKRAGYLETIQRGVYRKIKKIPNDLSLRQIRVEAYGKK